MGGELEEEEEEKKEWRERRKEELKRERGNTPRASVQLPPTPRGQSVPSTKAVNTPRDASSPGPAGMARRESTDLTVNTESTCMQGMITG